MYNPKHYEDVVANYQSGKHYLITEWAWGQPSKYIQKQIRCLTIEEFNKEVWDLFAEKHEEHSKSFIWGPFGLKYANPYNKRDIMNTYCDGSIFFFMKSAFLECVNNQDVAHFLSYLLEDRFANIEIICV